MARLARAGGRTGCTPRSAGSRGSGRRVRGTGLGWVAGAVGWWRWRQAAWRQAPEQYRRRPEATTAVPQTGQVVVTLSSRTGAAAGAGGAQPVGVGAGGDDQRVERQAVDDRSGQARVGEGLAPLAERGIAGHRDGGFLLAFGDDLEQQLRAARVEVEVAELVAAQQVQPAVAGDGLGQGALVGGLDQLVDQRRAGRVAHGAALLARGDARPDEQVGLAGARVAEQDQRLAVVDPGAR